MRAVCRVVALAVFARHAGASEVGLRTDMEGEVTFKNTGVSDVSTAMLTETAGIVCYSDWQNPVAGHCNAIDFSNGASPEAGPELVLTSLKAQRFTVSRFSDNMGVVCYTLFGSDHGRASCHTLSLSGSGSSATLSAGDSFEFDPNSIYPYTLSVVGLTETTGVLCYQDTTLGNRRLTCLVLKVTNGNILEGYNKARHNQTQFDNIVSTTMAKVSDTEVVVCYTEDTGEAIKAFQRYRGVCNRMSLTESGEELSIGRDFELAEDPWSWYPGIPGEASPGTLSVAALSDSRGVACYCHAGGRGPSCLPLDFTKGTELSDAGDLLEVGDVPCTEVSLTAMSETEAIVCYMAGSGQVGTCSGLVLNLNDLTMGDPTEIPAAAGASGNDFAPAYVCAYFDICDQWLSVSANHGSSAVACYGGIGGSETGRCIGLSIPVTTKTSLTSTTTATTNSETSSTTATQTSNTMETGTTAMETRPVAPPPPTTTTETGTSTPHTTTATETSVTTATDEPLSGAPARAAGCAAAIAVTSMLLF